MIGDRLAEIAVGRRWQKGISWFGPWRIASHAVDHMVDSSTFDTKHVIAAIWVVVGCRVSTLHGFRFNDSPSFNV